MKYSLATQQQQQIIGYMCKKSERHHLTSQWLRILQHLLAVITLLSHIAQRKPAPQSRSETASGFAMIADLAGAHISILLLLLFRINCFSYLLFIIMWLNLIVW